MQSQDKGWCSFGASRLADPPRIYLIGDNKGGHAFTRISTKASTLWIRVPECILEQSPTRAPANTPCLECDVRPADRSRGRPDTNASIVVVGCTYATMKTNNIRWLGTRFGASLQRRNYLRPLAVR